MSDRARIEFTMSDGGALVVFEDWNPEWHQEGGFSPNDPEVAEVLSVAGRLDDHPLRYLMEYSRANLVHVNVYRISAIG